MEGKGRRLIGASDGTDSSSENFKLWLTINASLHEKFIVDLRKKVKRGMRAKVRAFADHRRTEQTLIARVEEQLHESPCEEAETGETAETASNASSPTTRSGHTT